MSQRQELDQLFDRLSIWNDDKQRLISSDRTIPLKVMEIERLQKKYAVQEFHFLSLFSSSYSLIRIPLMN